MIKNSFTANMKILKKEALSPQLMGIRLILKDYHLNLKPILSQDKNAPNWVQVVPPEVSGCVHFSVPSSNLVSFQKNLPMDVNL